LNSIAVDAGDTVFTGGGGARITDDMLAVLTSSGAIAPYGTYYVFGVTPIALSEPRPSAINLTPASLIFSQNVGTQSAAQTVTISNFGGSQLNLSNIAAPGPFAETNNCPSQLIAGANCTVSVTFTPTVTGPANESLTVYDDSGNAGIVQTATLTGTGTAPAASLSPTSLSFSGQVVGTTSGAKSVTLKNTGTGPSQVTSLSASAPFSAANNCSGSLAPASSCTIQVSFTPGIVGSASGKLTITDNGGTQTVSLTGNGIAPVTLSSTTLNFGRVKVGTTSSAKAVALTNNRSAALAFSGIVVSTRFAIARTLVARTSPPRRDAQSG